MTIRTRIRWLVALLIFALLATCALSLYTLHFLRIGGPLAVQLNRGSELVADVLPPPKYIVETHLLVHQLVHETDPVTIEHLIGDLALLEQQFFQRTEYWNAAAISPNIAEQLNIRSTVAAKEYFDILNQWVVPQLRAGRKHLALAIVRSDLDCLYNRHRVAIDSVVELANIEKIQLSADSAMSTRHMTAMVIAAYAIALTVVGLGLQRMADGITRPLASTADVMRQLANGDDCHVSLDVERCDEIGHMTRAFAQMVTAVRQRDMIRAEQNETLETRNVELQAAKLAAEAASIAKDRFLANMSHEIRTPLNGVIGSLDIVGRGELDDTQRRFCHTAMASAKSLLTMLSDVLDLSKLSAGKLELVSEPVPIRPLIVDVGEICRAAAKQSNLVISTRVCPGVPGLITTDGTLLRQVLINLMTNAVKFTASGEVALNVSVDPAPAAAAAMGTIPLRFSVTDTGIGIPADRLHRLFKAFSQADATTTRRFGGTGLGLVISQEIVRVLGGHIDVDSTEGVGSTFAFTACFEFDIESLCPPDELGPSMCGKTIHALAAGAIPNAPANSPATLAISGEHLPHLPATDSPAATIGDLPGDSCAPTTGIPGGLLPGLCILLTDDNEINRLIASSVLESLGCRVVQAEDGAQAIAQWKRHNPAAIFMDCQMPEMDGYEATRQIRAHEATAGMQPTPIIALTANALAGDREKCLASGMTDFLTKPVAPECIEKILRAWCPPGSTTKPIQRAA